MKKIFIFITLLLLAACGGGGGAGTNLTNVTPSTPTGTLLVTFAPDSGAARELAATHALAVSPHVRIVISNSALILNGVAFKSLQDASPSSPLSFALPIAAGYTVEAVTYTTDSTTGLNTVLRYARAQNISVGTTAATANLTLGTVQAKFILPAGGVVQGSKYSVQAAYSTSNLGRNITPLQSTWYMPPPKTTPFTGFINATSTTLYGVSHQFTAPFPGHAGLNLYFQGVFTLKPALLDTGETAKQWVFNYPNPSFNNVSTPILAPSNFTITTPSL